MKVAPRRTSTDISISSLPREALQPLGVYPLTRWSKDLLRGSLQPLPRNFHSTKDFSSMSKPLKTTPNTKLRSGGTGPQQHTKIQKYGTKESSTASSSPVRQKPLSSTGKQERSIPTTTIRNPFTLSQFLPPTLLCDQCGRSTFTLTLGRTGRRPFIEMRCTCCGTSGKVGCEDWSKIVNSSPRHRSVAPDALLAGHKEVPVSFDEGRGPFGPEAFVRY